MFKRAFQRSRALYHVQRRPNSSTPHAHISPFGHAWRSWRLNLQHLMDGISTANSRDELASVLLERIPWGFLNQSDVKELVQPRHEAHQHTLVGTKVYPESPSTARLLDQVGGKEELEEGVKQSYLLFAKKFCEYSRDWEKLDVATPALAALFLDQVALYRESHVKVDVDVQKDNLNVTMLGIWMEEGSASKPGKYFGWFDVDEIKYHLLSGFVGPEVTLASGNVLGEPPRRIVTAFRIDSRETLSVGWVLSDEDPVTLQQQAVHYWVLETDFKKDGNIQWRVRNVNDATKPDEGEKIPFEGPN